MADTPIVSVVMPAYNRERYLPQAIESVLAQSFRDFELLVIDDGSSDRTAQLAGSTGDPRVRVIRNERNLGVCASRNRGLDLARGELVANLDSDDLAHPERLARQVAHFRAHPGLALLGGQALRIDENGNPGEEIRRPCGVQRIRSQLLFRNCFKNTTVMGRRDVLLRHRHREEFFVNEDVDLHVRVALDHEVDNLPVILSSYRAHGGSLSAEQQRATRAADKRIAALQLERLGVAFEKADLDLHHRLRWRRTPRLGGGGLRRAEAWLRRLAEANRRSRLYPEPWFRWVLGNRWWWACRFSRASALRRWSTWIASPLALRLPPAAADAAFTRLRGRDSW